MRAIMVTTFLGLRNFLSFLLLTMCLSSSVATVFHPNVFCVSDNQLTPTKRCFSCYNGRSCFIPHRPITTRNKHGCTCLLLPSRDLTICMDIERNPGPPCSLLDVHSSAVSFDSMPARHSFSTIPIGPVNGCQVVSPHCLVAPAYVAPTEVTSPQHRSCVAPTSKLRRPNAQPRLSSKSL